MSRSTIFVVCLVSLSACVDEGGDGGATTCLRDGELGPLALRMDGERAWLIQGADEIELGLMGAGTTTLLRGAGHEGVIGIAQNTDMGTSLQAFDRAGVSSWSASFGTVASSSLWVGPEGLAVATSELLGTGPVGLVLTPADSLTLPGHVPIGAPAGGVVAGVELVGDSVFGQPGWIALPDGGFTPTALAPIDPYAVRFDEDRLTLEYTTLAGPGLALVVARPGSESAIELPAGFADGGMAEIAAANGAYRLLRAGTTPEAFALVDLDLEEATMVEPTLPDGWDWFECTERQAGLNPDGGVLFELRSAAAAQLWAYDVDEDAWTELGLPMSGIEDIEIAGSQRDVHVVRGIASGLCPDVTWMEAAPADALIGDSLQVVRRTPEVEVVISAASEAAPIDRARRCVAFEDAQGWQVQALDGTGSASFPGGGTWVWID